MRRRPPPSPRRSGRGARLVAVAAVLQLVAGLGTAALLQDRGVEAPAPKDRARAVPAPLEADLAARRERTAAVEELLAARSRAVLSRDRTGFLATVDPAATELRDRQEQLFDALAQVPIGSWDYLVDPVGERPPDATLDVRYGRGRWWAPDVSLRYGLDGFDARPTVVPHHLTFVQRGERWLLAADDDFAAIGLETPRALWDGGPVVAERAPGVLALGHPGSGRLLRDVAQLTSAAIPGVSAVWGQDWPRQVVVLLPEDAEEMADVLGTEGDLSRIAAVATAELTGSGGYDPTGDRVLVNPATFSTLSRLGRQVVLRHEVTHVATRRATGPAVPAWLAEGLADHVAYRGVDVPLSVSARELRQDVRAGRLPTRLPLDGDFDGANPALAQAYEQAWLAVRMLSEVHGDDAVLRFYRAVGAARDVDPESAVETALRDELGTTPQALVTDWRAALQRQLG